MNERFFSVHALIDLLLLLLLAQGTGEGQVWGRTGLVFILFFMTLSFPSLSPFRVHTSLLSSCGVFFLAASCVPLYLLFCFLLLICL